MKRLIQLVGLFSLFACVGSALATDHFVRPDGAPLYYATGGGGYTPVGGCNGLADASYASVGGLTNNTWYPNFSYSLGTMILDVAGHYETVTTAGTSGDSFWPSWGSSTTTDGTVVWTQGAVFPVNQNCATSDFRYLYDSTSYGPSMNWTIAGGDKIVIRGCHDVDETLGTNTHCRIGSSPPGHLDYWCQGLSGGNAGCSANSLPAGTIGSPTIIEGACALTSTCNSGNATINANLQQIFGGNSVGTVINASSTNYVRLIGLDITDLAQCVGNGSPAYPHACGGSGDDYAINGIYTNAATTNLLLQDVNIHGMVSAGLFGPFGAGIVMTRVASNFNGFAGWNMDNAAHDSNGANATIAATYLTMKGNGCNEEYPIVDAFPAKSCYDTNSAGFGDSFSGQSCDNTDPNCSILSFTCDHCTTIYNTKDGSFGPHVLVKTMSYTHSQWYGNMGSQLKWGTQSSGTTIFQNNYVNGNCYAMSAQIPGASQNFNQSTGLGGSYLTNYCRAAGAPFAINTSGSSTFLFAGNTIVAGIAGTTLQMSCVTAGTCASTTWQFTDNIFLGYTPPAGYGPFGGGVPPALWYTDDTPATDMIVHSNHNLFFGNRNDDCTGGYGGITLTSVAPICASPLLAGQPVSYTSESVFYPLIPSTSNLYPGTPAIHTGVLVSGMTDDYYGVARPNPPSVGFAEPAGGSTGVLMLGGGVVFASGAIVQ